MKTFQMQVKPLSKAIGLMLLLLFCDLCYGQNCYPSIELKITCSTKKVSIDSLPALEIQYKITNTGDKDLIIDKNAIPEYENEFPTIYFKVYKCVSSGCKDYYIEPLDIQKVAHAVNYTVKPRTSYLYNFKLFKFYAIPEIGHYRIVGFYKRGISNEKDMLQGFYLQESNKLDITVVK